MAKEVLRLKITDLSRACVNDVDGDAQEFLAAGGERDRPKLVMVRSKREAFACRDRRSRQDIVTPHDSSSGAISLNPLVGAEKFSVVSLTITEQGAEADFSRLCRQTASGSIRSQSCSDFEGRLHPLPGFFWLQGC